MMICYPWITVLRELLDYCAYGFILDGIFLEILQFDGINYLSVQVKQQIVNVSQAWRAEFVRMITQLWDTIKPRNLQHIVFRCYFAMDLI